MLSRVANSIYWMARYVERAENTARIVNVNANLLLDLPKKVTLGWEPLIDITGRREVFDELYEEVNERNVVRFLIADPKNPGSLLNALHQARENARTIRDIIPREAWEAVNALYLNTKSNVSTGLAQRRRFDFLGSTIADTQQLTGLLAGTMLHDHGYAFLRMGRNLERADMTTRIVDVRYENLLPEESEELIPFENIQWLSLLQSLSAYQSYRQKVQGPVRRGAVLRFLFQDIQFPRAFHHCIGQARDCLRQLPRYQEPLEFIDRLVSRVGRARPDKMSSEKLHEFIDKLQVYLGRIHDLIHRTYFQASEPGATGRKKRASSDRPPENKTRTPTGT